MTGSPAAPAPPPPPAARPGNPAKGSRPAGLGCLLAIVVAALLVVGGLGLVVFSIAGSASSSSAGTNSAPGGGTQAGSPPLTVRSGDSELIITVSGASAQPGGAWHGDNFDPAPNFVVVLSMELTNATSESVITPSVGWSFVPAGSSTPAELNEFGGYQPSMSLPRLAPSIAQTGYLAFDTTATAGTLTVVDSTGRLADWELTATTPTTVVGIVGEPVRGQIGLPLFTVTQDRTSNTDASPELLGPLADSGNYLVADLTVTSVGEPFVDFIPPANFVFVPDGGPAVQAARFGVVQDNNLPITIGHGETSPFRVAFAAEHGPGHLEMLDEAGRTVISWPVG